MPAPGVIVTTAVRPGVANLFSTRVATYFVAGLAERGDSVAPVELRSMGDYEAAFGARVSYGALWDDLRAFFEEGGARAYVSRAVGPAASVGTRNLMDRAGVPLATLAIDAKDPGAWSSAVTVEVTAGTAAGSYRLIVRYSGVGGPLAEFYDNLVTPADAVAALASSAYVRARDLASATAAPNNQPAVLAPTALSAGADDRAAVTAAVLVTAMDRTPAALGPGAVAIPGQASSAVGAGLLAHARTRRRIALLATAAAQTPAGAIADAAALRANTGLEFGGLFYPRIVVPDEVGGRRTISPEGFVAGLRSRTIEAAGGAHQPPAGSFGVARFAIALERVLTSTESDDVDNAGVSAIRQILGGPRLYGWRSLSADALNWALLSSRDVMNDVVADVEDMLERGYVQRVIDEGSRVFSDAGAEAQGILERHRKQGDFYGRRNPATGEQIDLGYRVDTGPNINTAVTIAQGKIRVAVGVRVSPVGSLVEAVITKAAFGAPV